MVIVRPAAALAPSAERRHRFTRRLAFLASIPHEKSSSWDASTISSLRSPGMVTTKLTNGAETAGRPPSAERVR